MERTLYTARTHAKILLGALVIQILLLAVHFVVLRYWPHDTGWAWLDQWGEVVIHSIVIALEIWFFVIPVMKWWNTKFTLTTERVRSEWGVLYKHSREIRLDRISSISEERGIIDRIFGAGTLNFYDAAAVAQPKTSGAWNNPKSEYGIRFRDVPRVKQVRRLIEEARFSAVSDEATEVDA